MNLTSRFWWVNKRDLDVRGCARRGLLPVLGAESERARGARLRELSDGVVFMRAQ